MSKNTINNLILSAVTFTVCFFCAELGCRIFLYLRTPDAMVFDREIVYSYQPKSVAIDVVLNDIGCIGDDVLVAKAEGETRVLLLGGSTSYSKYYTDKLREQLNKKNPSSNFKVISCGRPRYTSYVNLVNYQRVSKLVNPELVVLYLGINDNIYNSFPWLEDVPSVGFFNWASTSSLVSVDLFSYFLLQKKIFSTPDFRNIRSAAIFRKNISQLIERIRKDGAQPVLSTFAVSYPTEDPILAQHLSMEEPNMEHFWGKLMPSVNGVSKHNEIMQELAIRNELPLADVSRRVPKDGKHFIDLCHLTTVGYDVLVDVLVEAIGRRDEASKK